MMTARLSGRSASIRSSTAEGLVASSARPRAARSSVVITQPSSLPGPVSAMTWRTPGRSARRSLSLATWASSSAKTMPLSESARM